MPRVAHFEIHVDDPDRAIQFYQTVFDWSFTKWGGGEYWLATTGPDEEPGINGGLIRRRGAIDGTAVIAYICSITVPAIDEYMERVKTNGGEIVVPKMPVPGIGWLAYGKDTEGNIFGMMQNDSAAA